METLLYWLEEFHIVLLFFISHHPRPLLRPSESVLLNRILLSCRPLAVGAVSGLKHPLVLSNYYILYHIYIIYTHNIWVYCIFNDSQTILPMLLFWTSLLICIPFIVFVHFINWQSTSNFLSNFLFLTYQRLCHNIDNW